MANPSERNFSKDVESGLDIQLADSEIDNARNSYISRVNHLLRTALRMHISVRTKSEGQAETPFVGKVNDDSSILLPRWKRVNDDSSILLPINDSSAPKVNDFLGTERDETVASSAPKVNDFLGTKRDEPINYFASEVNDSLPRKRRVPVSSPTTRLSYFRGSNLGILSTQARNKRISIREKAWTTDFQNDTIDESASTTESDESFISPMGNTLMHIAALGGEDKWAERLHRSNHIFWISEIPMVIHHCMLLQDLGIIQPLRSCWLHLSVSNLKPPYSEKPKEILDKILAKNKQGNTFFHEAVLNGEKDVMKILDHQELDIEPGFKELVERAALFWSNKEQKSILHIAIEEGYEDTVVGALNRLNRQQALDEFIENHQELSHIIREAESPFTAQDQGRETKKEQVNSTAVENLDESQIVSKYMRYIDMRILMKSCSENVSPGNIEINKLSEKSQEQAQLIPRAHDYVPPAAKSSLIAAIFKHRGRDRDHGHVCSLLDNIERKSMANPSERNFSKDVESGLDSNLVDSKRDKPINSYASRVNNLLRATVPLTKSEGQAETTPSVGKVNDSVPTEEDHPETSFGSRVNDHSSILFPRWKRDEPINDSSAPIEVNQSEDEQETVGQGWVIGAPPHSSIRSAIGAPHEEAWTTDFQNDTIDESASTTESDENFISPMGNTLMHIAALGGEDKWVEEIAQIKPHLLDKRNSNGDTPLHVAARFRHNTTLEKLLVALVHNLNPPYSEKPKEALDKILAKNKQGNTFFHEAVLNGEKDVMKILDYEELHIEPGFKELVERAALFWSNKEKKSILHIAIEEGYEDTVVGALNRLSQRQALDEFIQNHQELSHIIREAETPFTPQDQGRETKKEQVNRSVVENLDESQSPVRNREIVSKYMRYVDMRILMKKSSENVPPGNILTRRIFNQSEESPVPRLIPGAHDDYVPPGKSALIVAIFKHPRGHGILHKILEKKKEWIDHLKDNEGRSVIHYAASMGYLDIVDRLLGMQTDWHMERDNDGFFPLHFASAGGHLQVIDKLLRHTEDIEHELVNNHGRNFIHIAAAMGKYDVIRSMLDRPNYPQIKEMVNFKDVNGNTPLHLATSRCHPKVVHALAWDERVDCSLVNKMNETALDVCMQFQREFSSLRQRLIRIALESAGSQKNVTSSQQPFKLPPRTQNDREEECRNMNLYKDRINTLMLVSTLITTVTFAAGFTLPGGTNSSDPEKGMALMLHHVWFKIFVFCITISMYGSISVTIILIWAQLGDINLTRLALKVTVPLLGITLTTLSLAFLAGVHLVISDLSWLATTLMVLCVIFIIMLVLLYMLLWFFSSSGSGFFRFLVKYPLKFLIWLDEQGETHEAILNHSSSWYARVWTRIQGRWKQLMNPRTDKSKT